MNEEVEKFEDDVFDRKVEREDVLVEKLLSRGLVVSDELQLRKIIRLVGYYRLTGYLYPFRQEGVEGYVKGTALEQIWRLYTFDRRLRGCVMDALSRIEVAVRVSVMENHAAMFDGLPRRLADARALEVTAARRVRRGRRVKCAAGGSGGW